MVYKDDDKYGLRTNDSGDNKINILKALVSIAPGVGGAIASLMSDYMPSMKQERFISFVEDLATKIEELKEKINIDYINSESFALIFENALLEATKNYQKQKIEFLKGLVINSLIQQDMREDKEYYLHTVNKLSNLQLTILAFLYNPAKYLLNNGYSHDFIEGLDFSGIFRKLFPEINIDIIKASFGDLYQNMLINTNSDIFNTMTSGSGISLIGSRLSNNGRKIVEFCLEY